jgi:signal transduction histidine kinase
MTSAVELLERDGEAAFAALRDPTGPFAAKDTYVFVVDLDGACCVHPAFPNVEGQDLRDLTDARGRHLIRDMIEVVRTRGEGWVEYMWPKPGESNATQKSTYVKSATLGGRPVLVGCGVYLPGAPSEPEPAGKRSATELMTLVREAAELVERKGEAAYAELRTKGSKWFEGSTYFFVWDMDGNEVFHAADPSREGVNRRDLRDILGRPTGKWFLEIGTSPSGEGWLHYMFPEPGHVFPSWKSTFAKRVNLPSGEVRIVCCGVYDMRMDEAFIEDVVDRAAALVARRGRAAFPALRDKKGPFVFMDTYVFVLGTDGIELVNGAQPGIEGKDLLSLRDIGGKAVARDEIDAALTNGRAWTECQWFRPGDDRPARKKTFVRSVQIDRETFIVGSGIYR